MHNGTTTDRHVSPTMEFPVFFVLDSANACRNSTVSSLHVWHAQQTKSFLHEKLPSSEKKSTVHETELSSRQDLLISLSFFLYFLSNEPYVY